MSKYSLKEAPPEIHRRFLEIFAQDASVKELKKQKDEANRQHRWATAIHIENQLRKKKEQAFDIYMEDFLREDRKIDISETGLPEDVKELMHVLYITAFMACDIIESAVLDMNDTLKKHDTTLSFEVFDDIKKMSKNAKEKIEMFHHDSGYLGTPIWGERCDDMYQMMKNKARKIYRKNKDL